MGCENSTSVAPVTSPRSAQTNKYNITPLDINSDDCPTEAESVGEFCTESPLMKSVKIRMKVMGAAGVNDDPDQFKPDPAEPLSENAVNSIAGWVDRTVVMSAIAANEVKAYSEDQITEVDKCSTQFSQSICAVICMNASNRTSARTSLTGLLAATTVPSEVEQGITPESGSLSMSCSQGAVEWNSMQAVRFTDDAADRSPTSERRSLSLSFSASSITTSPHSPISQVGAQYRAPTTAVLKRWNRAMSRDDSNVETYEVGCTVDILGHCKRTFLHRRHDDRGLFTPIFKELVDITAQSAVDGSTLIVPPLAHLLVLTRQEQTVPIPAMHDSVTSLSSSGFASTKE